MTSSMCVGDIVVGTCDGVAVPSSPAIAAMASICSCWLGRAPCRVRRRFAAQSLRAKICVWWQLSAVVQRQPSARAATFGANFAKKNGVACGSLRHTAPHGVTYLFIESSRNSRRLYGVYRNQTRDRGPAARATKAAGTQPKPRETPQGGIETSLWVRSGRSGTSTWPCKGPSKGAKKRCAKLEARAAIHRYLGAMLQLTKTQH